MTGEVVDKIIDFDQVVIGKIFTPPPESCNFSIRHPKVVLPSGHVKLVGRNSPELDPQDLRADSTICKSDFGPPVTFV
jgi:hypothetical protein